MLKRTGDKGAEVLGEARDRTVAFALGEILGTTTSVAITLHHGAKMIKRAKEEIDNLAILQQ